jgi:membrane protease YdiL (CAAX protease family)
VTSLAFGLAHPGQWVQGVICGAAFQWLVIRKKRLGDAMTAHAITNLAVGAWAVGTGQWQFT